MTAFLIISAAAIAAITWVLFSWTNRAQPTRANVAFVDLEGDKSPMRYLTEMGGLMAKGYREFSKKGIPFSVPNLSDPESPLVILPLKYLDEVAQAPQSILSLPEYFYRLGLLKYCHGPPITEEVQRVARIDLNRALNDSIPSLRLACASGFRNDMPGCREWTSVAASAVLMKIFVHMGGMTLVGPELCDEWKVLSLEYIPVFMKALRNVRVGYSPSLRWIAPFVDPEVKKLIQLRRKIARLLRPVQRARLAELDAARDDGKKEHRDAIQWLLKEHKARRHQASSEVLADNLLVFTVSSTLQTTETAMWLLFDLLNNPHSLTDIREEISRVRARHEEWDRRALDELRILDSFMAESLRAHTSTETTVNRMVMKPFTLSDGFHLPPGTQISFATKQYNIDPDLHSNPERFDPKRHLRKREQGDPAKYHFASTADNLAWGSGPHACPGRYLVQVSLKLMFIHLLVHYDFSYPSEGKTRPSSDVQNGITLAPDMEMEILFREKHI